MTHGHDDAMRHDVARVIERLGLKPIILHEQPSQGLTIIEKFEQYSDVPYAIVLLSPDDKGCGKSDFPKGAKHRARQNVILELGFFLGRLGRDRVAVLYKNDQEFEIPSDYRGVIYIPYNRAWEYELVKELKAAGFPVSADSLP